MELIEIGLAGLGTIQSLLLLLLDPRNEKMMKSFIKAQVENYMNEFKEVKHKDQVREMLTWILDDKFLAETHLIIENNFYFNLMNKLKDKLINLYFTYLKDLSDSSDYNQSCDIYNTIVGYVIQIMRLRLVIQPEIQISVYKHPVSEIDYLIVKGFWINDKGEKVRKFTKSLAHKDDYKLGRLDPEAMTDGRAKIQSVVYECYKDIYRE